MFINEDIIIVIFRLINFIAIIGLFVFLFKKHIMPDIWLLMAKEHNDRNALLLQQTMLEKQQIALDLLVKEESLLSEQFKIKISQWKKTIDTEREQSQKEYEANVTLCSARTTQRALQKESKRLQITVANIVIPQLQESLALSFNQPEKREEFLNIIVRFMDENT